MLSVKEVSERLGIHEKTVYIWAKQGKIKSIRMGKLYKITEEEVEYIKKNGTREPKQKDKTDA